MTEKDHNLVSIEGGKSVRIRKMKKHVKKHWKYYAASVGGIALGSAIGVLTRQSPGFVNLPVFMGDSARTRLGRPSNITLNVTTKELWGSQGAAAKSIGTTASRVSEVVNGKRQHINGNVFKTVGKLHI